MCVHSARGRSGGGQPQQAVSGCRRNAAAHASAAAPAQTMAALLSIPSERPRWRFPPSANKGPGHPACPPPSNITQRLPQFPSIPPAAHLTPGPAEKTKSFSPSPPSSSWNSTPAPSSTSPMATPSITRLPPYGTSLEEKGSSHSIRHSQPLLSHFLSFLLLLPTIHL